MIFIDSTFFVGAVDQNDDLHATSKPLIQKVKEGKTERALTTDYVLNEVISILNNRADAKTVGRIAKDILNSPHIEVIFIDRLFFNEALLLFEQYKGDLSITDAATALIMQKYRIKEIYSHDSDFDKVVGIARKDEP